MATENQGDKELEAFIRDEIDSVPHLEALLILWKNRGQSSTIEDIAQALFVDPPRAKNILNDLAQRGLLNENEGPPPHYRYDPGSEERDGLMRSLEMAYRRELVRVTGMIHSKGPSAARAFARAFRFTKDKEHE